MHLHPPFPSYQETNIASWHNVDPSTQDLDVIDRLFEAPGLAICSFLLWYSQLLPFHCLHPVSLSTCRLLPSRRVSHLSSIQLPCSCLISVVSLQTEPYSFTVSFYSLFNHQFISLLLLPFSLSKIFICVFLLINLLEAFKSLPYMTSQHDLS